jgi:hypothetical protein
VPRAEIFERRTKTAKHFRNEDRTYTVEFATGMHYWDVSTGGWKDRRMAFATGPGADEWVSAESDVQMRTYETGAGAKRRSWVEFTENGSGRGIRFELSS